MSSTHTSLDAASTDRKARLAKLASLKRKQPGADATVAATPSSAEPAQENEHEPAAADSKPTDAYLSGRNYDVTTQSAKLGFENAPVDPDADTVEQRAQQIAQETSEQAAKDDLEAQKGIDLFRLQPKKPNWDLKRDLGERTKVLDVRTQNAIARLVRERIETTKNEALKKKSKGAAAQDGAGEGEEVGIEGASLVEGIHLREQEEEDEKEREREEEEEATAAFPS